MDTQPLYAIKAELFKALAHPVRIRVLEEIAAGLDLSAPVSRLLDVTGAEPSALSQHLAVLKRAGVVDSTRSGNAVLYRLTEPLVADLLVVARAFLLSRLAGSDDDRLAAARRLPTLPGASARAVLEAALAETAPVAQEDGRA
ncbi:ArsR/SmtB family transcription factor [Promicromonospora thailandica]|uniref:ArsR family transcriptional regulator n=1 Tax=Promicromonospora thailandica TaxID=765201 RepID=A0A9X2G4E1_9MICO|nr:metalloregulator ArsR/SmtB family transcription factor [Promicromonospora thailandica]MCP2265493.1 ArsR family transcriptional regulator [Promicromonospora thailandica]BFF17047.1 metalloregulator ArsR/SmtB family transcription factor [Promicromonospora thailandica]